jgi:hypothetical protein
MKRLLLLVALIQDGGCGVGCAHGNPCDNPKVKGATVVVGHDRKRVCSCEPVDADHVSIQLCDIPSSLQL